MNTEDVVIDAPEEAPVSKQLDFSPVKRQLGADGLPDAIKVALKKAGFSPATDAQPAGYRVVSLRNGLCKVAAAGLVGTARHEELKGYHLALRERGFRVRSRTALDEPAHLLVQRAPGQ